MPVLFTESAGQGAARTAICDMRQERGKGEFLKGNCILYEKVIHLVYKNDDNKI